jgi:crotonobetainyl-CoA:carnitine CoA-transferase CaiB-like acyl-CoA transferase
MRDQNGHGVAIDISMQDTAVSATATPWNVQASFTRLDFLQRADGYVCIEHTRASQSTDALRKAASTLKRSTVVAEAAAQAITAVPLNTVSECATSSQTSARQLIVEKPGDDGRVWPCLAVAGVWVASVVRATANSPALRDARRNQCRDGSEGKPMPFALTTFSASSSRCTAWSSLRHSA